MTYIVYHIQSGIASIMLYLRRNIGGKYFFFVYKREIGKILQLKYKYRSKEFWCKGYYVDTVGKKQKGYANTFRINCVKISWENSYPSIPKTRLRVAGNNPTQLADRTYVFYTCAKNGGLCPHMKNHAFYAWLLFCYDYSA